MKVKFLAVNKQDPSKTTYVSKKQVGVWLWGRQLSSYILMIVGEDFETIVEFDTPEVTDIQKKVDELFEAFTG